ncbi:MAG: hypothetical protein NTW25_08580, partial [Candidatus Kapabacteria bacterium]|nr:hypothetical protein [Candidatus Kapabacteria bacterium]
IKLSLKQNISFSMPSSDIKSLIPSNSFVEQNLVIYANKIGIIRDTLVIEYLDCRKNEELPIEVHSLTFDFETKNKCGDSVSFTFLPTYTLKNNKLVFNGKTTISLYNLIGSEIYKGTFDKGEELDLTKFDKMLFIKYLNTIEFYIRD